MKWQLPAPSRDHEELSLSALLGNKTDADDKTGSPNTRGASLRRNAASKCCRLSKDVINKVKKIMKVEKRK